MQIACEDLTAQYVRATLFYEKITGIFLWRKRKDMAPRWNTRWAGRAAGRIRKGYLSIKINGKEYHAARLAWLIVRGKWPRNDIDHRDTCKLNNAWGNLRLATRSQNLANRNKFSNNKSGFKGVSFHKSAQKWRATIIESGRSRHLGYFPSPELASLAYRNAAIGIYGQFARF